ncbi:MAG TPA: FkbM family methyltransferase [Thermoanaerobaculia bacterium]|nr:FkbM family methyltransferase [Thermoanaerobaculia bacterium]
MRLKTRLRHWLRETVGVDVRRWPHPETLVGHLVRLLRATGVDCVLDVGANVGQFAASLRAAGFAGDLVSIEPAPEPFAALARRAARDPRWHALRMAVGEAPGEGTLQLSGSSTIASLLPMEAWYRAEHPRGAAAGEVTVPIRPLDWALVEGVLGRRPVRLCLKSDTQGYEAKVLAGATEILPAAEVVQVELSVRPVYVGAPDWRAMIDRLAELGFDLAGIFPVAYDRRLSVIELDGVFRRR